MGAVLNLFRYILLFIVVLILSAALGQISWQLFNLILPQAGGSFPDFNFSAIAGSILAYAFLSPLFVLLFGERHSLWALVGFLIPIVAFEILTGISYIGTFLLLILLGSIIGYGLRLCITVTFDKMPWFAGWKKYF